MNTVTTSHDAAARILENAHLLKTNTERGKAIPAKRYKNRMLRELPNLTDELTDATIARLQARITELASAYAAGDAVLAGRAYEWITIHLLNITA